MTEHNIPPQRVCKVCGKTEALIKTTTLTIPVWTKIQFLHRNDRNETEADYNYLCKDCNPIDNTANSRQTYSCRQCKDNRAARSIWSSEIIYNVDLTEGGSKETLDVLRTTNNLCCKAGCQNFEELVKARIKGICKSGVIVDPCENCIRFWNKDHPLGPCIGAFEGIINEPVRPEYLVNGGKVTK